VAVADALAATSTAAALRRMLDDLSGFSEVAGPPIGVAAGSGAEGSPDQWVERNGLAARR